MFRPPLVSSIVAVLLFSAGCALMVPDAVLPVGPAPNPDVASWPEYTLKIGDKYLTLPFCQTETGWPLDPAQRPGDVLEVDMPRSEGEAGAERLASGRFEWNAKAGLHAFGIEISVIRIDGGGLGDTPLDRFENEVGSDDEQMAVLGCPDRRKTRQVMVRGKRWLLIEFRHAGAFRGNSYSTALTDDCCFRVGAFYWPHPRPTERWLDERRRMVREVVERVRFSDTPLP